MYMYIYIYDFSNLLWVNDSHTGESRGDLLPLFFHRFFQAWIWGGQGASEFSKHSSSRAENLGLSEFRVQRHWREIDPFANRQLFSMFAFLDTLQCPQDWNNGVCHPIYIHRKFRSNACSIFFSLKYCWGMTAWTIHLIATPLSGAVWWLVWTSWCLWDFSRVWKNHGYQRVSSYHSTMNWPSLFGGQ